MFQKTKRGSILYKLKILIKVGSMYILELGTSGFERKS